MRRFIPRPRPPRDGQAGLTMVEIMVSLALVSIASAFVFAIQSRTSQVLNDQSAIAEMQQTLRAATEQVVRDLRQAGYLAREVRTPVQNGTPPNGSGKCVPDGVNLLSSGPVSVENSSDAPDLLRIQYSDGAIQARITEKGPSFHATVTSVEDATGFQVGDYAFAVHTRPPLLGYGCLIQITDLPNDPNTNKPKIGHNHGQGNDFNLPSNCQCDGIESVWDDGYTVFTKVAFLAYRIKPADSRGILQMSTTGGTVGSWVDLAVGIVDLQVALRVYQPDDLINDTDGDGDTKRDWFSGEEMETILAADPDNQLLQVAVTMVAKTEVHTVDLDHSPDLIEEGKEQAYRNYNRVGDRFGVALPVTDVNSMYYGEQVYRSFTASIDFRNIGVGN